MSSQLGSEVELARLACEPPCRVIKSQVARFFARYTVAGIRTHNLPHAPAMSSNAAGSWLEPAVLMSPQRSRFQPPTGCDDYEPAALPSPLITAAGGQQQELVVPLPEGARAAALGELAVQPSRELAPSSLGSSPHCRLEGLACGSSPSQAGAKPRPPPPRLAPSWGPRGAARGESSWGAVPPGDGARRQGLEEARGVFGRGGGGSTSARKEESGERISAPIAIPNNIIIEVVEASHDATTAASSYPRTKVFYTRSCRPLLYSTLHYPIIHIFHPPPSPEPCAHSTPPTELAASDKPDVVLGDGTGMCLDDGEPTVTPCTAGSTLTWTGGYFHGPRAHQHLVLLRLLTGAGGGAGLPFKIRSQDAFGATVLAEGTDATGALYWVHALLCKPTAPQQRCHCHVGPLTEVLLLHRTLQSTLDSLWIHACFAANGKRYHRGTQPLRSALARSAPGRRSAATWPASGGDRAELAEPRRRVALVLARLSKPAAPTSRFAPRERRRGRARAAQSLSAADSLLTPRQDALQRIFHSLTRQSSTPNPARALLELGASMVRHVVHHSSRTLPRQHHSIEPLTLSPSSRTSPVHSLALAPVVFNLQPRGPSRASRPNSSSNRIFPQIRISGRRSTRTSSPYFEPSPRSTEPSTSFAESTTLAGIELTVAAPPPHVAGELRASPGLPTATNRLVVSPWFFSPTSPTLSRRRLAGATPATSRGSLFIVFLFPGFPVKKSGTCSRKGAVADGFYHLIPADGEGTPENGAGEGTIDPEANPQLAQEGKPRSIT
ncbi:hypothetical protein HU200_024885 [Digitaria exilis]|uniref:Uncharacterized protein n=1 Tax=Digitaria exilis TaxID=1010633 RepID=A0A835BZA0_9POAL|nr:hypothetical protein HU200_024885 [Digitaria exilis]